MSLTARITATGTDEIFDVEYFAYIRQEGTALYLDFDDNLFKAFNVLVTARVAYVEDVDQPGVWSFTHALPVDYTGGLEIISRGGDAELLVPGYELRSVSIVEGAPLRDLARPEVLLHTDLGGLDTLRIADSSGVPLEGVTIRIFTKTDYDAGALTRVIGITTTDILGRWRDAVPVTAGSTYVVLAHQAYGVGPVSFEVSV